MRRSFVGFVVVGAVAVLSPQARAQEAVSEGCQSAQSNISRGSALMRQGDYASALAWFQEAALTIPAANALVADALFHTGQVNEAYGKAQEALSSGGNYLVTHLIDSQIAFRLGKNDEGFSEAQQAVAMAPNAAEAHTAMGSAYYLSQQFSLARAEEEKMLQLAQEPGETAVALANLAELDELDGQNVAAEQKLDSAIEAAPDEAWSFYEMGFLYELTNRSSAAQLMMRQAVALDAGGVEMSYDSYFVWPELRLSREAMAAEANGNLNAALTAWTRVSSIETQGQLHFQPLAGHAATHIAALTQKIANAPATNAAVLLVATAGNTNDVARVDDVATETEQPAPLFW